MKILTIYFSALLLMTNCNAQDFDSNINQEVSKFHFTKNKLSYQEFKKMKEDATLLSSKKETQPNDNDEYALTGFVNTVNPKTDDLIGKYELLNDRSKLQFIQNIIKTNNIYYKVNIEFFSALLDKFNSVNKRNKILLELIRVYTNTQGNTIENFKTYLSTVDKLNFSEKSFLLDVVCIEREFNLAYDLLVLLAKRKDWSKHYIKYWTLFDTKNKELNNKYKEFFKKELLSKGYQENPWNGFNSFLPKWFSQQEIIEICEIKKSEKEIYNFTFYNKIRDVTSLELYISNAGIYQAKYFSVENTIDIIETLPIIGQKLVLTFYLVNVNENLNETQKKRLKSELYKYKNMISESTDTRLLIKVLRHLDSNISFNGILSDFPNLYKDWYPENYLQNTYNSSKYNWLDFITKANELNTFENKLNPIDDYYLAENMAGNYSFNLEVSVLESIFKKNNINVSLNEEYGFWPIDYSYIIENSFQTVLKKQLNNSTIDYFHKYKRNSENNTEYQINVWIKDNIYSIKITDPTGGVPNNKALTLLFNKILIDSKEKERFVKYSTDSYNLTLVEPKKFKKLMEELK